ncbi:MAG: hypothetical protein VX641_04525 [Planctomycetota bacterium]|nr:hypothetical protein [Planctomycetota bacterium]
MTEPAGRAELDDRHLDETAIAEEIRYRERMLLRWPLLVGTAAVLYGSLMVIYIIIRLLSFLYIYMILSDLPPSGALLLAQVFPLVDGFILGGMLFVSGIITLRRRLLGPRLINLWSFLMLLAIVVTLFLRLQTLPDFVDRQMVIYDRILQEEALITQQADPGQLEEPAQPLPNRDVAQDQLASEASQFFVAFAIMGACGPAFFWCTLNLPRIRRSWILWD